MHLLQSAVQLEGDHSAEAELLPPGEGVVRMSGKSRIVDLPDIGMAGKEFGDPGCVLFVEAHPGPRVLIPRSTSQESKR